MRNSFVRGCLLSSLLTAGASLLVASAAQAQVAAPAEAPKQEKAAKTLTIGDKAPALSVEKWLKGSPVSAYEPGKVYVVEFWATWCGPCIRAMPHLAEVQKKFKDKGVTVISCTSVDPNNSLEKVEKMVAEKAETMQYTVAWDKGRETNEAFMDAAGQNGIPCAFIVDQKGKVAWIGHPMQMDDSLQQIVDGKFDTAKFAADFKKGQERDTAMMTVQRDAQQFARLMKEGKDFDAAYKLGATLVEKGIEMKEPGLLNMVAWTIVDPAGSVAKKDIELAMKAAVKADELTKGEDAAIIDTLARVHFVKGDVKKAVELQTKAVDKAQDEEMKADLKKALDEYKGKAGKTE